MTTIIAERGRHALETLLSDRFYRQLPRGQILRRPSSPTTIDAERALNIPFGDGSLVFEPAPAKWIVPFLEKVCELGSLPANWNSYRAQPIHPEIAAAAAALLLKLLSPDDPAPSIVPTSRGGILLEWHEGGIDLEVDVRSPSRLHVALEDGDHEEEWGEADVQLLEEKLKLLRSRIK